MYGPGPPPASGRARRAEGRRARSATSAGTRRSAASPPRCADARERFGGESILPFCYGGSNGYLTQDAHDARLFRRLGASRLLRTVCAAPTGAAADRALRQDARRRATGLRARAADRALGRATRRRPGIHLVRLIQGRSSGAPGWWSSIRAARRSPQADLHLALRPGTDLPRRAGAASAGCSRTGAPISDFLAAHATGADALRRRAPQPGRSRAPRPRPGVAAADLERFARLYADACPGGDPLRLGARAQPQRRLAVAAILALPAVAGKFGVRGGGYTMSNSRAPGATSTTAPRPPTPEPPTRAVNMNQLGAALTGWTRRRSRLLFVYNATRWRRSRTRRRCGAGWRARTCSRSCSTQVWTDTARWADVVLPATTFLEHDELARGYGALRAPRGAAGRARRRARRGRTTTCSASWCGGWACGAPGDPEASRGADRRPAGEHARRAALREALARDGARRAGVRRDARPVRRRLPADAGPQDPSRSPRR